MYLSAFATNEIHAHLKYSSESLSPQLITRDEFFGSNTNLLFTVFFISQIKLSVNIANVALLIHEFLNYFLIFYSHLNAHKVE